MMSGDPNLNLNHFHLYTIATYALVSMRVTNPCPKFGSNREWIGRGRPVHSFSSLFHPSPSLSTSSQARENIWVSYISHLLAATVGLLTTNPIIRSPLSLDVIFLYIPRIIPHPPSTLLPHLLLPVALHLMDGTMNARRSIASV